MVKYNYTKEGFIQFFEQHNDESQTNGFIRDPKKIKELIDSGVEITPYTEPVKTLEQLQNEAVAAMAAAVIAECRSGTGKLYFSDLNSASMYANAAIQLDTEIYDRAVQLLKWSFAIDAYALDVVFGIEQGGEVPTLESFIAGLPTV